MSAIVGKRLRQLRTGQWETVVSDFLHDVDTWCSRSPTPPPSNDDKQKIRECIRKLGVGRTGEAKKALLSNGIADVINDTGVKEQMAKQFVPRSTLHPLPPPPKEGDGVEDIKDFTTSANTVLQVIKGLQPLKAHGTYCHRNEFFSTLVLTHNNENTNTLQPHGYTHDGIEDLVPFFCEGNRC